MPKMERALIQKALLKWHGHGYGLNTAMAKNHLGLTKKQIQKYYQGAKFLKCSPIAYAKLNVILAYEKQHYPALFKAVEAKYGKK